MRAERYQIALIILGIIITAMLARFLYREINPEYRIYQNDYIALEEFRSTYTGESPPAFSSGVKQIVFEREDKGPAKIDRCVSCHVAEQLPHFSPTKIAHDSKGNIIRSEDGTPVQVPNENYVWARLDKKIAELTDEKVDAQLVRNGDTTQLKARQNEAEELKALKIAQVGDQIYDVTKVLQMHPLIGKETRPFEFHNLDEYGCTSCHSGNGRALTTDKAHGPVFDGQYEIEYQGPTPEFIEKDLKNDPRFSKVFNNKPSDALLFQTTPILVGSLIQANCIQCHIQNNHALQGSEGPQPKQHKESSIYTSEIDSSLTQNYLRGQQLYISQACYGCHKIAGLSRGGIGPELTREGENYPWFIKEKLVWPQGDLRTSTMPNFKLDHIELEDLMTFLFAQKGQTKSVSEIGYKMAIQSWENGRKQPWEKPITPAEEHDLRYAMTIFATQGCAACHRLEGFQSNIGYSIEKGQTPSFDALYRESQWFQNLFPEEAHGSDIVRTIEKHAKEIDKRIVNDVRQGSLLDEIDSKFPETIEAFYSNFRYASRAKNEHFKTLIDKANTSAEKQALTNEQTAWQERVHKVLMTYVQEYGLGRLIGPRPNWSGVYRSDEWLMEHFHNPAGHVPHSIMPVMPFDDSKFYALTYMLDKLGKQNRDKVHAIWDYDGFNPEQAFQIHCAQCHGEYMQGNGPVAAWIYPIPKNLRNAEFLRNLTKENAIRSIKHGVKGTPMPPWGETPKDKQGYDGIPVLNDDEIVKLVNWMYSTLPGATVIRGIQDVPKWYYTPHDVLEELKNEGGQLLPNHSQNDTKQQPVNVSMWNDEGLAPELRSLPTGSEYFAALNPKVHKRNEDYSIDQIFDVTPNPYPIPGGDHDAYYIKRKFYTERNIERGKEFFELNCAPCHGAEADGSGIRASIMTESKPRMLTNLDWIKTHDDMRLLRSIKYGVPGTAMTPWGDLTTSLQRLQLVIFIRSLSQDKNRRDTLLEGLYTVFEKEELQIENLRSLSYPTLNALEQEHNKIKNEQIAAARVVETGMKPMQEALTLYQKQLEVEEKLRKAHQIDKLLVAMKQNISDEHDLYQSIGMEMLSANVNEQIWTDFLSILNLIQPLYKLSDGKLVLNTGQKQNKISKLVENIVGSLDASTKALAKEKVIVDGKLPSPEKEAQLRTISSLIEKNNKLKTKLLSSLEETKHLRLQGTKLYNEYQEATGQNQ